MLRISRRSDSRFFFHLCFGNRCKDLKPQLDAAKQAKALLETEEGKAEDGRKTEIALVAQTKVDRIRAQAEEEIRAMPAQAIIDAAGRRTSRTLAKPK